MEPQLPQHAVCVFLVSKDIKGETSELKQSRESNHLMLGLVSYEMTFLYLLISVDGDAFLRGFFAREDHVRTCRVC